MSVGIKASPQAAKKLLDSLQNDLRTLSTESKRKHPDVKEAAETIQLKLRTISTKHESNIIAGLVPASSEIVRPFVLGCETKNPKLVPICLSCVQRLISYEAISTSAAEVVIDMLWTLMESGQEELKLLQTAILLLTTNSVVQHDALSRALVLCFRLHFTKDSTTINTAAATIKQLVSAILDRVLAEDQIPTTEPPVEMNLEELKAGSRSPPKSLRPCAADAYLLFQDLCQLVNADQPFWLNGMTEMTRTFGLELLEAVLMSYPAIFSTHPEFSFMLKEKVCPLVIKLFSPSLKYRQGLPPPPSPAPVEKPFFPIVMRLLRIVSILIKNYYSLLVTECEIFLSLLVKFMEPEKPMWQRCLALEVLHKLSVQPELVKSFCESYDMKQHSTKIFRDIVNALGAFIQSQFMNPPGGPAAQSGSKMPDTQGTPPAMVGGMPVGGGVSPQPAFMYRGVWIPLVVTIPIGQTRSIFLEMLDKLDHPLIPDGYGVSVAFYSLLEMVASVRTLVLGDADDKGQGPDQAKGQGRPSSHQASSAATEPADSKDTEETESGSGKLNEELITSSWCGMLAALSLLLDASTDESATEAILKSQESYAYLCGHLGMTTPRDAFITALCKASLPPHYTLTILNSHIAASSKALNRTPSQDLQYASESVERSQVVAVGTALPTASLSAGAHQGPVMLTAKNIQVMRALLSLAHCHGGILGTAWHLVLTTLQHLVWILGLKPSNGGSLKASQQISETTSTVITTAVMADLPVLAAMLSRLFESSQYLNDVALHHLIDALCKLSMESMEVAFSNREPSLFAVAKLLETGLVNVSRLEVLWRPVTAHLLEVCQHTHGGLRNWAAEAVTSLVKAVLNHKFDPPLHLNVKLQVSVLAPLQELSGIAHGDIRQRQLDCVLQVLHSCGDTLQQGWPLILGVIGAVNKDHNEKLVQMAFQCLQLVVTDYLPVMGSAHLEVVVEVAARFGLQTQELNVSLTAIGLLWNISDNFFQNRQRIKQDLDRELPPEEKKKKKKEGGKEGQGPQEEQLPPFDALWMCLFRRLGDLCVDSRPAVRKSAGQTLFSTVSAHGGLLQKNTWRTVLWKVLFPLLENVKKLSSSASTSRDEVSTGNILIHHSRDTAEKQWAETRVLSLAGVARTFNAKRRVLQQLGDFPRAWSLLLEYIETSALCRNAEVSLAALKSFQEILQINRDAKDKSAQDDLELPQAMMRPPSVEEIQRSDESSVKTTPSTPETATTISDSADNDIPLWSAAWRVWLNIGTNATRAPDKAEVTSGYSQGGGIPPVGSGGGGERGERVYVPSQHFLSALMHTFPALFEHIKTRFITSDLQQFSRVLHAALSVPVHGDASPFIIPSYPEVTITPLQEASLQAMDSLIKAVRSGGSSTLQSMYPDLFEQLLTCATFGVQAPSYGAIQAKSFGSVKGPQVDWVTMNFVPFSERALEMVVEVYRECCSHHTVIQAHVLQSILKMLRLPLGLKYDCPSSSTWQEAVSAFHSVLSVGLSVARKHVSEFEGMWHELGLLFEDFLFTKHPSPPTLSMEDFSRDEAIDCKMVHLIRDEILPYANTVPNSFVVKVMELLNRGSIHSAMSDTFVDTDSSRKLREDFAKTCFETLLQFSFISKKSEEGAVTKVAVLSLLQRCQEVVKKYVDDERLSGKCPLPRPRLAEITAVLKAITTLLQSLKKAPSSSVEGTVWQQVIVLYPALVECTTSSSPLVTRALKDALHEYRDLLTPPSGHVQNGR